MKKKGDSLFNNNDKIRNVFSNQIGFYVSRFDCLSNLKIIYLLPFCICKLYEINQVVIICMLLCYV